MKITNAGSKDQPKELIGPYEAAERRAAGLPKKPKPSLLSRIKKLIIRDH